MALLDLEDKYYTIGEVSRLLEIKPHVLHFWEQQFPQLRPARGPNNRRRYRLKEIGIIEQIKHLLWAERYTIEGARQRLQEKPHGSYRPSSIAAMRQLVKEIETGIHDALDIIDSDNHHD